MKHLARWGSLAMVLGCAALAHPVLASGDSLASLLTMPNEFLLHRTHGYLGVDTKNIDSDRALALKLKDPRGAEIVTVDHDAPAGKAGLRVHDVILRVNGHSIGGVDQLRSMLHAMPPGRTVAFLVSRDGNTMKITLQLADRAALEHQAWLEHFSVPDPDPAPAPAPAQSFLSSSAARGSHLLDALLPNSLYVGVELNPVRPQLADYFGVSIGSGLLVESVDGQSPAARAGLKAGDVIVRVNALHMTSRGDWLKAIRANRGKQVQLTIVRNKQQQTLTMTAVPAKKAKG